MTGVTAEGRQAYAILSWANDDPAERAAEAVERVDDLAGTLTAQGAQGSPALREVQDVGTVLARLHSAVTMTQTGSPPADLAGTITEQAALIDLADWDPASHPRDPHGRFVSKGTVVSDIAADLKGRSRASVTAHDTASAHAKAKLAADRAARDAAKPSRSGSAADDIGAITSNLQQQFGKKNTGGGTISDQIAAGDVVPRADFEKLQAQVKALQASVERDRKAAVEKIRESGEKVEDREKANLVKESIITLGGAVLIGALTGGIGSVVAVPYILEKSPEIVGLLYSHFVVGKGYGRHLVAHPAQGVKNAAVKVANHPKVAAIRSRLGIPGGQAAQTATGLANDYLFAQAAGFAIDETAAAQTAAVQVAQILAGGGMPQQDADDYARAMLREYVDTHHDELDRNGVDTARLLAALQ